MSEPVGNGPRQPAEMPMFPGNTHKDRAKAAPHPSPKENPPSLGKIVEGPVVKKKAPLYSRALRSLVAEDAQSIGGWVMDEIVLPSIRNLLADTIKGSTDRIFYGSSRQNRRMDGLGRPRFGTAYNQITQDPAPRRLLSRESRARHNFDEVILSSRSEAASVLDALTERVAQYGVASVADLYALVDVTGSYADQNWGWTDLRFADLRQVREGYLLDLPRPESIR